MKIKPDPNCKWCRGSGIVYDSVSYGSTTAQLPSTCECVEAQVPEDYDGEIEIDLSEMKEEYDPTEFVEPVEEEYPFTYEFDTIALEEEEEKELDDYWRRLEEDHLARYAGYEEDYPDDDYQDDGDYDGQNY